MIYLSAVAHLTCGEYGQALKLFVRLNRDYPDYKREQYIGDGYTPDPQDSVRVQASVAKLIFALRLQSLPESPRDPWSALQQVTSDAVAALDAGRRSAIGGEPDQLRASALPDTLLLEAV
jgi:hypothetical protein